DLADRRGQRPGGLDGVGAVERLVVEVDGLVRTHGQGLADGLRGPVAARAQHGDFTVLGLLDLEGLFDRALVDLIQHGVRCLAVQGEVPLAELALGPGVRNLLDQYDNVWHRSSPTSCGVCGHPCTAWWNACASGPGVKLPLPVLAHGGAVPPRNPRPHVTSR